MGIFNLFSKPKEYMSMNQIQQKITQVLNDYDKAFSQNIGGTDFQHNLAQKQINQQLIKKHNLSEFHHKGNFSFVTYLDDTLYLGNVYGNKDSQNILLLPPYDFKFNCAKLRIYCNNANEVAKLCLNDKVNVKVKLKVLVSKTCDGKVVVAFSPSFSEYDPDLVTLTNSKCKILGYISKSKFY